MPEDKIIEAHGSFATHRCIECKSSYPDDLMRKAISKVEVPHCLVPQCNGLVKPDIVFFGEALPEKFHKNRALPSVADLCIVMGTSLSVQPFASLPSFCSEGTPRLLINSERVGGLGSRADDVLMIGDCDTGVRELARALGWTEELETLWDETHPGRQEIAGNPDSEPRIQDDNLDEQIATLTGEVEKCLKISSEYTTRVQDQLKVGNGEGTNGYTPPDRTPSTPLARVHSQDEDSIVTKEASQTDSTASHDEDASLHADSMLSNAAKPSKTRL